MFTGFTASIRGGSGAPLVCLHRFMETWRSWELVLPRLRERHDVLALTLPGHAGGPPLGESADSASLTDGVERMLDDAGIAAAHLVGNSLGGHLALRLAARGRALSVVAFAPAGGWADGDESRVSLLRSQLALHAQMRSLAPRASSILEGGQARRRATELIATRFEHIPRELLEHQMLGIAGCRAARPLVEAALREGFPLEVARITCPVRLVWGTADRLLPWPEAARFRNELPQADWALLDGVGHCPQLDVPLQAAELILGFTA